MANIIDTCISKSRAVMLTLCFILLIGTKVYLNIPKEAKPDIQIPIIWVSVMYHGISSQDASKLLAKPLENNLKNIDNIKKLDTYSFKGGTEAIIEFETGFDVNIALQDVRNKVAQTKSEFPAGIDEPIVGEVNLSKFPVLNVALYGNVSEHLLSKASYLLKNRITQLENVLKVREEGKREEVLEITIDQLVLYKYGLTIADLNKWIVQNNKLIAAGDISNAHGKFSIKIPGVFEDTESFLSAPIKVVNGEVINISQIAKIKRKFEDPKTIVRTNGIPSIILKISKKTGANIIETIKQIKKMVDQEKDNLPSSLNIAYSLDESENISNTLSDLENNIILAIIFSMIPITLAIGARSAMLVAISIPLSFLMGILILNIIDLSLNIVVIFSLILSIGMLVDASIVVCEYADNLRQNGFSAREAYSKAALRMWVPVFSATSTTLVVFLPLFFWPGIVGEFMKFMPITIIATVSSSLFVAYIFIPILGTIFGGKKTRQNTSNIKTSNVNKLYTFYLTKVINKPGKFVLSIISFLLIVIALYTNLGPGVEFFPQIDAKQAIINIKARGALSIEQKDAIAREAEKKLVQFRSEIKSYDTKVGSEDDNNKDRIAEILVEFVDWKKRDPSPILIKKLRHALNTIAGIIVEVYPKRDGPSQGSPFNVELSSTDSKLLQKAGLKILKIAHNNKKLIDISSNMDINEIEWEIIIDRAKAARYGVNIETIGTFIQMATKGLEISRYRPDNIDDEIGIVVRLPEKDRNLSTIDNLFINTTQGNIPVSNFITRKAVKKINIIERTNGFQVIKITADLKEGTLLQNVINELTSALHNNPLDKGVYIKFVGEKEDQDETSKFLSNAFSLAIIAMVIMMLIQFNSFYQMMIIMSAVVLSTTGVLLGLLVTRQPFGIVMCGVGIIALAGTVVNNNIIFLDTYRQYLAEGKSYKEAIILTGMSRFRPIILTAATSVLGLLPMIFGISINFLDLEFSVGAPSSQWWRQISTTIAGGTVFATILTLFFTPCLLVLEQKLKKYINQKTLNL